MGDEEDCDKPDDDKCNPDEEDCDKPDDDKCDPKDEDCDKPDDEEEEEEDDKPDDNEKPDDEEEEEPFDPSVCPANPTPSAGSQENMHVNCTRRRTPSSSRSTSPSNRSRRRTRQSLTIPASLCSPRSTVAPSLLTRLTMAKSRSISTRLVI